MAIGPSGELFPSPQQGEGAEQSEAIRGEEESDERLNESEGSLRSHHPLIRPFGPPSPRQGEGNKGRLTTVKISPKRT
jgi:hypothetical protein